MGSFIFEVQKHYWDLMFYEYCRLNFCFISQSALLRWTIFVCYYLWWSVISSLALELTGHLWGGESLCWKCSGRRVSTQPVQMLREPSHHGLWLPPAVLLVKCFLLGPCILNTPNSGGSHQHLLNCRPRTWLSSLWVGPSPWKDASPLPFWRLQPPVQGSPQGLTWLPTPGLACIWRPLHPFWSLEFLLM